MKQAMGHTGVSTTSFNPQSFLACCVLLLAIACLFTMGCDKEEGRYVGSVYYPVNEQGQTYGSSALAYENLPEEVSALEAIDYMPDLVSAVGEDGTEGYIPKEDFLPSAIPSSPEEAIQMQNNGTFDHEEVPLYASDGETVLGVYANGY